MPSGQGTGKALSLHADEDKAPPPTQSGRAVRIYYVTQVGTHPPRFAAITNFPEYVAVSYSRYLQTQLRERFNFEAVPVRVSFKPKRRREEDEA